MTIDILAAEALLDFGARLHPSQAARAREQLEGAVALHNVLQKHGVAYLADEVGMGKTYVALGALALFRHFKPDFRVLVIAPRENLQQKWMKETRNFIQNNVRQTDFRVRGLGGHPARRMVSCGNLPEFLEEACLDSERDFFLRMTSLSLPLGELSEPSAEGNSWQRLRSLIQGRLPWLPDAALGLKSKSDFKDSVARAINCALPRFDLVIVDEAHNLKHGIQARGASRNRVLGLMMGREVDAKTPSWARDFGPRAQRVLFLSATPLEESFRHVWNQLDVFGKAAPFDALKAPANETSEADKKEVARTFLIRRVTAIPIGTDRYTKNRYRREWRHGGVETHDEGIETKGIRQRLAVALVQKKVSELLGHTRFGNRFQIGMLASFESFQETAFKKAANAEAPAVFDDGDQTDDEAEKEGIDVKPLNALARSYRKAVGGELPHPKLDAIVEALGDCWKTGRKALVFVRRVASVWELKRKLDDRYDAWLRARLQAELPPALGEALRKLDEQYSLEKKAARDDSADTRLPEQPVGPQWMEQPAGEESGGADTFFAWFFRGDGPAGAFSGATLKRRFTAGAGVYATFFEDNLVAAVVNAAPGLVLARLADLLQRDESGVAIEVEALARTLIGRSKKPRRIELFDAVQAAALQLLAAGTPGSQTAALARMLLQQRFADRVGRQGHRDVPLDVRALLEERTFFTELRRRPVLREALWPEGNQTDAVERLREHCIRADLLGSVARLGHGFIDLYIVFLKSRGALELDGRRKESEEDEVGAPNLVGQFLDVLERDQAMPAVERRFSAFDELKQTAEHFDLIVDTNFPEIRNTQLSEVRRQIGTLLGEQQPVGGMWGSVNKSLVQQFRMPGYPFVLVSTDLLQEGEDLHTFCSEVFHYGISWTPSAMEQRIGRVDRLRSKTERLLGGLQQAPSGEEKLQVYVPYLKDSVEVLQVNRVLRRMDQFMVLMHEGVGKLLDDDRKIDVVRDALEHTEPPSQPSNEVLHTSFPVAPELLDGRRKSLDPQTLTEREVLQRFLRLGAASLGALEVKWEPPGARPGALFGTAKLGERIQPFGLYLQSIGSQLLLRCISPIGLVSLQGREVEIAELASKRGMRIGAIHKEPGTYDLTVEDDVLLMRSDDDARRAEMVVRRVATGADALEQALLPGNDTPLAVFREDLKGEATHE